MGSRAAFALACALAWCSLPGGAAAQEADAGTRVAARELAVAGAEAYEQEDYATALERFQRAEQLYKVPSITVMVARCLARSGRVVEAVDKYEETLRMPLDASAPEAFQRAVSDASQEVEATRARAARLELRLPSGAAHDAQVLLDDRLVPSALLGVPMAVDPGTHLVTARAPGKLPFRVEFTLAEAEHHAVEVALAAAAPAPVPRVPDRDPGSKLHASPLTIALLAGGGVALVVGTVTGVAALNHKSALDESCSPGCPSNLREDLDGFRRNRTISYLGLGLGAAAAGAGAVLLWKDSTSGRKLGALAYPGGAFLTGSF